MPCKIALLQRYLSHFASSESIFILDTHGDIVVANTHDIQTKNYSACDFFEAAVNGNAYVSEPAMDQGKGSLCILTDRYGVRIAHATDRSLVFKSWIKLDPGVKKNLEMEHHYGEDIRI